MVTKRQQKANRKKWIAALESGKYEQGRCALSQDGKFCCLGVLVQALAPNLWDTDEQRLRENSSYAHTLFGTDNEDVLGTEPYTHAGTLTTEAMELVGLKHASGIFNKVDADAFDSLVSWNDSGATFKEIAALIQSEPKGLFTS